MFSFFSFGDIYKFSATTWWVSGTQGTRAHIVQGRQKLGKVGKGNKILEVWQKIKMHERGNKMFNFQPKRKWLQNLSSIEICLAVLWEYRDVLRTVEDETKISLPLWRNTWKQSVSSLLQYICKHKSQSKRRITKVGNIIKILTALKLSYNTRFHLGNFSVKSLSSFTPAIPSGTVDHHLFCLVL